MLRFQLEAVLYCMIGQSLDEAVYRSKSELKVFSEGTSLKIDWKKVSGQNIHPCEG